MSNWFGSIYQAGSGLQAARYGLDVVSQNMANASTPGYVRQISQQEEVAFAGIGLNSGPSLLGGVTVIGTSRATDPVMDARLRLEHANGSLADTTASSLSAIESVFNEPSDHGLAGQLTDFWNAWGAVANDPGSNAARGALLTDASKVAGTLNQMSTALSDLSSSTAAGLTNDVTSVNTAASQLATLNGQIGVAAATGANVNSLLDQRDQLLDKLSGLTGGTVTIGANGAANVKIGGVDLVNGTTASALSVDSSYNASIGGTSVTVGSGRIGSETTTLTSTIPAHQSQLDAVANRLSSTVNAAQTGGYDLAGSAGTAMFSGSGAAGIHVAITDPSLIAASGTPGGNLDGSNALAISQLGSASGSSDALYATLVGDLGTASAVAHQQATTQDAVVANVEALKSSVSGVSLDEEAANMLTYQQAFNASSRVLTAMDSMLDTLINHTGLVGLG